MRRYIGWELAGRLVHGRPVIFRLKGCFAIKKATRSFTNILRNQSGGVAVYAAIFSMLGIGAGALAIDIGRMTLLRAEMQNRADAGATRGTGCHAVFTFINRNFVRVIIRESRCEVTTCYVDS